MSPGLLALHLHAGLQDIVQEIAVQHGQVYPREQNIPGDHRRRIHPDGLLPDYGQLAVQDGKDQLRIPDGRNKSLCYNP